jgi:arylformamidase
MEAFSKLLQEQGLPVSVKVIRGRNHMSSVRDLGVPGTDASGILSALLMETRRS